MDDTEKFARRVRELALEWDASGEFAAAEGGKTLFCEQFGWADRAAGLRMTDSDTFALPLDGRMMSALGIMLLADSGALPLNEKIDKFIPEYPFAEKITVRQLLCGRSGIPDYMSAVVTKGLENDKKHMALTSQQRFAREREIAASGFDFGEVIRGLSDMPLTCEPGARHIPSGSEQIFCAELIRRVGGKTLFEFFKERLFDPLGIAVERGNAATAACYGVFQLDELVRLERVERRDDMATLDFYGFFTLTKAMAAGELFTADMWRQAQSYDEYGVGLGFENNNGAAGIYDTDNGHEFCACFDQKRGCCWASVLPEGQILRMTGEDFSAFRPETRFVAEGYFQRYTAPEFVALDKENIWHAMKLRVAPEQENFVCRVSESVCECYVDRTITPYLLCDCGCAVGYLALKINRGTGEYYVDVVLIAERFQHKGYGRFMVDWAVKQLKDAGAKKLTIGVNRENTVARHLYESAGFRAENVFEDGVELALQL